MDFNYPVRFSCLSKFTAYLIVINALYSNADVHSRDYNLKLQLTDKHIRADFNVNNLNNCKLVG